jgi:integrase
MARSIRSQLEGRSHRLTLSRRRKPYYERIGGGVWLGYRRTRTNGRWVLRCLRGGSAPTKTFAQADDYDASDGKTVLTYFEAQALARTLAGAGRDGVGRNGNRPVTVGEAVADYEANLKRHGRDTKNAQRIRCHLKDAHGLANIYITSLTKQDFAAWEKSFEDCAPATTNRVNNSLRAALNRAAKHDKRITTEVWTIGLERLENADRSRNVILLPPDYKVGDSLHTISAIISTAYSLIGFEFGLLVEVAAQTGARYSQLIRLTVGDVRLDGNPRLMMPVSKKGWGKKDVTHRPVPITSDLAHRLPVQGRPAHAPLLTKKTGSDSTRFIGHAVDTPWAARDRDYLIWFKQVVDHLKDDPGIKNARFAVTMYSLRHSSIARQLLDGISVRIVASYHDTSVEMIEKNYAVFITDFSDALSRKTLAAFAGSNVVSLPTAKVG